MCQDLGKLPLLLNSFVGGSNSMDISTKIVLLVIVNKIVSSALRVFDGKRCLVKGCFTKEHC